MKIQLLQLKPGEEVPKPVCLDLSQPNDLINKINGDYKLTEKYDSSEVYINSITYCVVFEKEGEAKQKMPSLAIAENHHIKERFYGDVYFIKLHFLDGYVPLNDEDVKQITDYFEKNTRVAFCGEHNQYSVPSCSRYN